jgi:putative membrane protein
VIGRQAAATRRVITVMGWYGGDWGPYGLVGMLMMVVVWGGLIALAVWVISRVTRSGTASPVPVETPRAILDRRFASGEMAADAYAEARRVLDGSGAAKPGAN